MLLQEDIDLTPLHKDVPIIEEGVYHNEAILFKLSIIVSAMSVMVIWVMSDQTLCKFSVFSLFTSEALNSKVDVTQIG